MKSPALTLLAALTACATVSCGNSGGGGEATANQPSGFRSMSERLSGEQGFSQDGEGQWVARNNQRSQFEARRASGTDRRNTYESSSRFDAKRVERPEWSRAQSTRPQEFAGPTDGSAFQTTAAAQGAGASETAARARLPGQYATPAFGTSASRENKAKRFGRPANAETERRRESFEEPAITDWHEQRNLSIEQARSILSR